MIQRPHYMDLLEKHFDSPLVKMLVGIKRTGKSSVLALLADRLQAGGILPDHIISINFEADIQYMDKDAESLFQYLINKAEEQEEKYYFLLDEIQEVEDWENAVFRLQENIDCEIYVTRSTGQMRVLEEWRDKYVEIPIYPFCFWEYLEYLEVDCGEKYCDSDMFYDLFLRFLKYGGFPGVHWMSSDEELVSQHLKGIYAYVMLKDVIQRNKIRDAVLMEEIVRYLVQNIGKTMSVKSICDFMKSQGKKLGMDTVYSYVKVLEESFLFYKAPRYDIKGERVLETLERYFLCDAGISYGVLGYQILTREALLENAVYLELLRRGYKVYVGKFNAKEIDFVAMKEMERIYIQVVDLLDSETTVEKELASLKAIRDNFVKLVISFDKELTFKVEGIKWINAVDFLMNTNDM
ncbi:ATP-binding protein [Anaeromicropila populeti]|uniref:AAA domain-containing protein n=1 Tax=Anaeromicropila populeti TaxID=37658 RepID=A0A1I6JYX8_9FIRM|nr:ATP-binding protein [Anaeromicropila populeti]SFR84164.1 hypothetical protein SAMN05661086_02102 [Anaeromicropila populeti]